MCRYEKETLEIINKEPKGKHYTFDWWRVHINSEIDSRKTMSSAKLAKVLTYLYRTGKIDRIGNKGEYFYKVI